MFSGLLARWGDSQLLMLGVGLALGPFLMAADESRPHARRFVMLVTLHGSLSHEVLHGHPTRSALVNELLVFIPISMWFPYRRYKSLHLHDPVWYDHLPYLKFPENWPVFAPKDKIGDWLEMYTKVMELNYWGSTTCKKASFDEASQTWNVVVERGGQTITLKPKQLVLEVFDRSFFIDFQKKSWFQ